MARYTDNEPFHVGLEIGTSKVRAIAVKFNADRSLNILGAEETTSVGVSRGEISADATAMANASDCVKEVLRCLEDSAHIRIRKLLLSVDGEHFVGKNQQAVIQLNEASPVVTDDHIEELKQRALVMTSSSHLECLHEFFVRYRLDGQDVPISPRGVPGRNLAAEYHIISGVAERIRRTMSCVEGLGIVLEDVVFAPIAAAQCLFTEMKTSLEYRRKGSLLIDIGGGSTKYAMYHDDALIASGSIPVAGKNATRDVQMAFELTQSTAEFLKINEANVARSAEGELSELIYTPVNEHGFAQPTIDRALLNYVLRERFSEIFRMVHARLPQGALAKLGAGVFLCGGSSLMRGVTELCGEIFGCSIYMVRDSAAMEPEPPRDDLRMLHQTPQFVTPMGLIRYAELARAERSKSQPGGLWAQIWSFLGGK